MKFFIEIFPILFAVTNYQPFHCLLIVANLIDALRSMRIPVVEIQYDDAYVLIDAIIISLRIKKCFAVS